MKVNFQGKLPIPKLKLKTPIYPYLAQCPDDGAIVLINEDEGGTVLDIGNSVYYLGQVIDVTTEDQKSYHKLPKSCIVTLHN